MRRACALARRYLGATSPNPPVGAVALNADGAIIAEAAHERAGAAHAEAALLHHCRTQNILAQIHTLVVTLEPCNHHGKTLPCTQAILDAKIKHIAIGARDPNPDVAGGGIEYLRAQGVQVTENIALAECEQLIAAFATVKLHAMPWITIKRVFDAQGSMIPPAGQKTFASPSSLLLAHRLRKKSDAIITGSGTILADNPLFTVRHVTDHPGKTRILAIADRRRRVPESYRLSAESNGFQIMLFDDLTEIINELYRRGVQDILIEAGPTLSQAVFDNNFWHLYIDIECKTEDHITAELNPDMKIPFDPAHFHLTHLLPA